MRIAPALGLVLAAVTIAWLGIWAATPLPDQLRTAGIDLGWMLASGLAGALALVNAFDPKQRASRPALLALGAGALVWSTGQAIFTWYDLTGPVPYPSVADLAYLSGLPLLALGVALWPRTERGWRAGDVGDALLMLGAVALASYAFVLEPVIEGGIESRADLILVAYPIADAMLLGALLVGLTLHTFRQPGRLLVLALGLVAIVAADTGYAIDGAAYETGSAPYDLGWTLGFGLVGAAMLCPAAWSERFRLPASAGPIGVLSLLAAAGAVSAFDHVLHETTRHAVGTMMMEILFVALALRYLVVARSRQHKAENLESARATLEHEFRILEATIEASRTGMCLYDADGNPTVRNAAWSHLLGDDADLSGRWAAIAADPPARVATADGRSLEIAAHALASGERLVTVDDVTDEEREREARDRFLAEVVGAQDLEARRIAEVLHDDVVQQLTALGMRIELAALRTGQDALLELSREAGAVTASIRRLLIELHPAVLESQGLGAAIDAAAGSLRSIGVSVDVDEFELRLAPELEALAYRLVQEALANAFKHARAERVTVGLAAEDGLLRCRVADDGVGFEAGDAASAVHRGSLGLHLVRERIELAGGRFSLESEPGRGTSFEFELPLGVVAATRDRMEARA